MLSLCRKEKSVMTSLAVLAADSLWTSATLMNHISMLKMIAVADRQMRALNCLRDHKSIKGLYINEIIVFLGNVLRRRACEKVTISNCKNSIVTLSFHIAHR